MLHGYDITNQICYCAKLQHPPYMSPRGTYRGDYFNQGVLKLPNRDIFIRGFTRWATVDLRTDHTANRDAVILFQVVNRLNTVDKDFNMWPLATNQILVPAMKSPTSCQSSRSSDFQTLVIIIILRVKSIRRPHEHNDQKQQG